MVVVGNQRLLSSNPHPATRIQHPASSIPAPTAPRLILKCQQLAGTGLKTAAGLGFFLSHMAVKVDIIAYVTVNRRG